ncbi:MAG: GMC family oxidoreductase [Alphaproteobacteria bacterium]|nr:GMC family oxidoreductase [Alphaproteobacteria bacterium]MCB9794231.1 GMC family oxidoreductase [Alphaproteobacteria bacterium]
MNAGIHTAGDLTQDLDLSCDVCIIGSGAGGGTLAAGLATSGLNVVMLEAGSHYEASTFSQSEREAYPALYQDRGARSTADGAITVLQGRAVGGGTTVNWTTCFRTPERVLKHWAERYGLEALSPDALAPHFEAMEGRTHIGPWPESLVNGNNGALLRGCRALGWHVETLRRNVNGCRNSGLCGLGCPYDAKQGMLLTTIPDAIAAGMVLLANTQAWTLEQEGDRVTAVKARVLHPDSHRPTGVQVTVRPKVCVVAGGALNSPALMLRSGINPNGLVGHRTMLHPVVGLPALYPEPVAGWAGAPQSAASHHFAERGEDKVGFFMEVNPLQPMLAAAAFPAFSPAQGEFMARLPYLGSLISLCIDGLHPDSPGGVVSLKDDGSPKLDYPVTPALVEAMKAAHIAMAQVAFAAGAERTSSYHNQPVELREADKVELLGYAPFGAYAHAIFTAHQMGGCQMGADPEASVVDVEHRVRGVPNLFVVDGSVFPTSLGVNPSLSIYAIAHRARRFVGEAV